MVVGDVGAADPVGEHRHAEGRVQGSCRIGTEDPAREEADCQPGSGSLRVVRGSGSIEAP